MNENRHTFTENGSFEFVATDIAGNESRLTINVSNIDKIAPIVTVDPYTTEETNQNITVYAHTDEGTLNQQSYTFVENGSCQFIATDDAGNSTILTITITNIDKRPTVGTVFGHLVYNDGSPMKNIKVTLHSDPIETYTNNSGDFSFINVPLGDYTLIIEAQNGTITQDITLTRDSAIYDATTNSDVFPPSYGFMNITGTILPTIVSFGVPTDITFAVNPNIVDANSKFASPEFSLYNFSNAPLSVYIKGTDGFKVAEGSVYKGFTDVMPNYFANWSKLGVAASMSNIAIGVKAIIPSDWRELNTVNTLYSKEVTDSTTDIQLGALNPGKTATMKLEAKHGSAFTEALSLKYKLTFLFELMK